ncbi:TetR/AcrR family transcriptional regulator C-terminal domain-containing protein [Microbacterium sp. NEAU-LLC]|uniref:TetR/AcrR family transcriptional regulator C-terminal domain-containing protein n=1 Tax=Microbacterium helvum TaxID=2773713 RepID=A0ABR8NPG1_9MICO|nr:TetR/AcrR family transcriptional regulator C-terminal domain-containing protein [Microbacterium helvum]MBD3941436.1 TetR/AcrR family transcriptional regulator C-terminal domain-containing protein [Microbacterium helvum]
MDDPVKSADRSPRAKREWHRGITRDSVANAAVALLDREGRKALTMRRLAQDLDVTAASLYFHVAGKDDLIELVVERVLDGVRLPPSPDLVAAFVAYRRALLDHSEAALLILEFPRLTQASARLTERSLTLLTDSGMPLREATDRHVTAVAYMLGWVLQELMPRKIAPGLAIDSPLVREAMSDLGRRETEDRFVIGLRLILGT